MEERLLSSQTVSHRRGQSEHESTQHGVVSFDVQLTKQQVQQAALHYFILHVRVAATRIFWS